MDQLIIDKQPGLDDTWFERLNAICAEAAEIYYPLAPPEAHLAEQYKLFFAGDKSTNPNLRPTLQGLALYETRRIELTQLLEEIVAGEKNAGVQKAYFDRINELTQQLDLLLAAHRRDSAAFAACNRVLYGQPSEEVFSATCAWLRRFAEEQTTHPNPDVTAAAKTVLELLPETVGNADLLVPPLDTFKAVQALHDKPGGYIEQLFSGVALPHAITERNGDPIVERVLKNIGCDYGVMEAASPYWGVSHTERAVVHPYQYHEVPESFTGILIHEIGSHLLERINGSRQPLRLLAIGLDRYDACNEGRAYLREQLVYDSPHDMLQQHSWRHIITMHLSISLASGLAGEPYDFKDIYPVINAIDVLWHLLHMPLQAATMLAQDETWKTLTRVMKGTDGHGAYLKDIVYLEGNVRCWQAAAKDPGIILLGDLGKFDITRPDHVELLKQLDILPSPR